MGLKHWKTLLMMENMLSAKLNIEENEKEIQRMTEESERLYAQSQALEWRQLEAMRDDDMTAYFDLVIAVDETRRQSKKANQEAMALIIRTNDLIKDYKNYARAFNQLAIDELPPESEERKLFIEQQEPVALA